MLGSFIEQHRMLLEKKALIVDSFAKFRVQNVSKYYTATSGDQRRAEELLKQRINNGLRNEISKRTLHEVVSGQRDELMVELVGKLNQVANDELGVLVVDVRVKRIDLPEEVSQSVYSRMNTERDIEAKEHRAKGQELAVGIIADADKQVEVILANAYGDAEEVRGGGDAEAAQLKQLLAALSQQKLEPVTLRQRTQLIKCLVNLIVKLSS